MNSSGSVIEIKGESLFQSFIENSECVVVLLNENLQPVYRSSSAEKISGWTIQEMEEMGSYKLSHPDDNDLVKQVLETSLKNPGLPFPLSIRGKHKSGSYIALEGTAINLLHDKNIKSIIVNLRVVTEQKNTEKKIRQNESRLNKAQEVAHLGSWEADLATNISTWSAESCRIYGLNSDDNVQKFETFLSFIHPDDLEYVNKKIKEAYDTLNGVSFHHRIIRKDGVVRHIYSESKFEFDTAGKPIGMYGIAHDITENKVAEFALQANEARYRSVVENIHESLVIEDNDGKLIYANNEFTKIFGFTAEEFDHLSLKDYTAAESYPEIVERHNNRINGLPVAEDFIYKGKRKDGTEIWIEARVSSIFENGKIIGTQSLERDITARKNAEEKMKESELRYRSLIEQASDAIMVTDFEGNFIDVNESMCSMFGYAKEELLRLNISELIEPEQLKKRPVNFDRLKNGQHVFNERRMIHKNGIIIEVEANVRKVTDELVIAIARDITERKHAEEKIKTSEEKFRNLFERNLAGVFRSKPNGQMLTCNGAYAKMLGYSSIDELLRTDAHQFYFSDAYRDEFITLLREKSEVLNFELLMKRKDGRPVYIVENCSLQKDKISGEEIIEGVLIDITERKNAEEKIKKQTEQLRNLTAHLQTVREEERLNMAHEIHDELGQQLTIVKMNLYSLMKKYKNISPEFQEQAELVGESINKTVNTVRKIASELRPVVLDEQGLDDALRLHSNEFSKQTGIPCKITSEDNVAIEDINVNTQVFRVFQESLTNVARHANASHVDATMKTENGFLKLMITDNGIGFNPEKNVEKKSLGLVMMRERATSINATLQIISEPNQGTSVLLTVPLKPQL